MVKGTTNATLGKLLKRVEKISLRDLAAAATDKKKTPNEVTELVASVLAAGIRAQASSIHIEPRPDGVHIRHRVDGVLGEAQVLPLAVSPVLIAGLKILVHLPVDETETLPQQAATTITVQERPYKLRIATIPVEDGEKAVVQLNALNGKAPTLGEIGYWGPNLKSITHAITKSRGLILLAGPHDAGQAEGAYSLLAHLSSPDVSIATIEDPIIYRIPGATQTQVNTRIGLNFSIGLQTMLRQDANVLMVSNLRDSESVTLAIEGALSGRLIIAGLYANDAASALGYLLAAGIEPYLVAHTLQAIVGQRVVRKLCENCKQIYTPTEPEMIGILKSLSIRTAVQLQQVRDLEQLALQEKLVMGASPTTAHASITSLYRADENGCVHCGQTGYKGNVGLYEVLENTDVVQRLIMGGATADTIKNQAIQDGMPTIQMDGLVKVLLGMTSADEVVGATA